MARKPSPDRAYLVRCWQEHNSVPGHGPHWHFSVEEVLYERKRRGFMDLEALVAFLRSELSTEPSQLADTG
jgi:hypothetical protein